MKFKNISEYKILAPTKNKEAKKEYWETAIGLQQVDKLQPSGYLIELAKENIEGNISNRDVKRALETYYSKEAKRKEESYECDMVSQRIVELLEQDAFTFSPAQLKSIHRYLFQDILKDDYVGKFRSLNISKNEEILNGDTVKYGNYFAIEDLLDYDFKQEKGSTYSEQPTKEEIRNLAEFTSSIWQVHPFMEGNTRTTAVFIAMYLRSKGFEINNTPFKSNSQYFRNALVRCNYTNLKYTIRPTIEYLLKFFQNLFYDNKNILNENELYCQFHGVESELGKDTDM